MSALESYVQTQLMRKLNKLGWWTCKTVGQSANGLPDVVAVKDGRTTWIEVKKAGGTVTPDEKRMHRIMRAHGAEVHVVTDMVGVNDFIEKGLD